VCRHSGFNPGATTVLDIENAGTLAWWRSGLGIFFFSYLLLDIHYPLQRVLGALTLNLRVYPKLPPRVKLKTFSYFQFVFNIHYATFLLFTCVFLFYSETINCCYRLFFLLLHINRLLSSKTWMIFQSHVHYLSLNVLNSFLFCAVCFCLLCNYFLLS